MVATTTLETLATSDTVETADTMHYTGVGQRDKTTAATNKHWSWLQVGHSHASTRQEETAWTEKKSKMKEYTTGSILLDNSSTFGLFVNNKLVEGVHETTDTIIMGIDTTAMNESIRKCTQCKNMLVLTNWQGSFVIWGKLHFCKDIDVHQQIVEDETTNRTT